MKRIVATLALVLWPALASAQFYPDYNSITVNDFADILPDDTEAAISAQLDALRDDTGIEMTVVTLTRQETYDPDSTLEQFATGLFNHWGVGNAERNDGIMVLVLPEDRAMRLELGAGFGDGWNDVADAVVQDAFLPGFRDGDYPAGIAQGVSATIDVIARPFAANTPPPEPAAPAEGGGGLWWLSIIPLGLVALIFQGKIRLKLRKCPSCGTRGSLQIKDRTIDAATRTSKGKKERTTSCSNCDFGDTAIIMVPMLSATRSSSSSSSSSFGGGSSSGGGASGKW
ncbi:MULTISPECIES: TPM domain-containing protein [Roseobacteraceae]|jgi:uncharacterized protein|uniref:TPM domain protein n=1 Tax=Pseudosulfitobacter pseudonitzschiae TaxID=1402135 RepID=A0A221K0X7_9RHOB|nr:MULTISPECIES: TPM domain-containing protein [Roseobacteraceae]ASM72563.1 TPM domain protein [Pseudosulfitobacter pseudonitzschiae]